MKEPVLIVDDNPTNLKLVAYLVSAQGYEVTTACDAPSALAQIEIHRPRLILMDLQLPGVDGLELTRRLKGDPATRDISIVAVTAYAMKGDLERQGARRGLRRLRDQADRYPGVTRVDRQARERILLSVHKIMVVDDNSATRRMVRNALQRNGHEVIEAPDGATARALMSERPRVVIQDLMLPDADGFELVGELRSLAGGSEISILAFSGFVSKLDEARVSTVGFDDIIPKPIAPSRLVPLVEAHLPSPVATADRFGAGRKLVVADDEPLQLKLATFRLARFGFEVEAVSNGQAALDAVRRLRPDAVVSDVMMPDLDGFGLALAMRQDPALAAVPILLVTSSYVEPSDRELARRAGANDLVLRTPELAELVDVLRDALADRGPATPLEGAALADLERERNRRVVRQLERQVMLNTGLAKRYSALASELTVLTGISEAVADRREVDVAFDEALVACFDAMGIAVGALYRLDDDGTLRVRPIGVDPAWVGDRLADLFGHGHLLNGVIGSRRPLYVPSPTVPESASLLAACQGSAVMLVPLYHGERPLGALLMVSRGRELDREDWGAFATGVATQLSQVLAVAHAFRAAEVAEAKAAHQAAMLDAIVENLPDLVFHIDLDGKILFANREGRFRAGATWLDLITPDDRAMVAAAIATVSAGKPTGFESATTMDDGRVMWSSTRLAPVKQGAMVLGAVVISRDVSDKKQAEMRLMLADRMASVGTLAAGVAHEINNPLASVIANLDMAIQDVDQLASRVPLPVDLVDELHDARAASERVRQIVRDLKIFSRSEVDSRGPVDVEAVLESTLRMAWNEIRHRARIVKVYGRVAPVDANESRLGQVFLNLIVNALQSIPEGQYDKNEIRVTTRADGDHVLVSIRDTGSGIPHDVRSRLFTPFFTTKPVGVGTGLGLAISHRIVTAFGGTITFDSEVGKGTEFRVTLPLAQARRPTDRRPRAHRRALARPCHGARRRRRGHARARDPALAVGLPRRRRRHARRRRARARRDARAPLRRHPVRPDDAADDGHRALPRDPRARSRASGPYRVRDRRRLHGRGARGPRHDGEPSRRETVRPPRPPRPGRRDARYMNSGSYACVLLLSPSGSGSVENIANETGCVLSAVWF